MKLNFLGYGGGFYPEAGSTSAYYIEGDKMLLIDCGESVFRVAKERDIFAGIKDIYFCLTHTHSDHIGSLGNFILYSALKRNIKFHVVCTPTMKYFETLETILIAGDCNGLYNIFPPSKINSVFREFSAMHYLLTDHSKNLPAYSIVFVTRDGILFYSGDSCSTTHLDRYIERHTSIDEIYVDTSLYDGPGNVHLSLRTLDEHIPPELRHKVYCMHFDSPECIDAARKLGFNTVDRNP